MKECSGRCGRLVLSSAMERAATIVGLSHVLAAILGGSSKRCPDCPGNPPCPGCPACPGGAPASPTVVAGSLWQWGWL
eukprot:3395871-Amphidinium_carterae.1